jgi:PAS domain S-box-containing protein
LKERNGRRRRQTDIRLILIGIGLGIVFWFLEALLHVWVFRDSDIWSQITRPEIHEVWMRLIVIGMFVSFGIYSHRIVAARRRAEEAVTMANAELNQIFETAADGMRVVDREFNVLRANETFAALAGMKKADIVGRKCHEVFRGHLCNTPGCPINRIVNREERIEYDSDKLTADGRTIPCIVTATPFRRPDGDIIGIVEDFKDISERIRWVDELMASRERIRKLASHQQAARETERSRIAREIHDELGQALTAMKMDVHWLSRRMPDSDLKALDKMRAISGLIDHTVRSVRRICSELRPGLLDDFGLSAAIEWQAAEFGKRTGIVCDISSDPADIVLDNDRSIAIFRIFQEALTNIARHAHATHVAVSLKEAPGIFRMTVTDDGKGLGEGDMSESKSFGLMGMRERAHDLGGEFRISSGPEAGTVIELEIPTEQRPSGNGKETLAQK